MKLTGHAIRQKNHDNRRKKPGADATEIMYTPDAMDRQRQLLQAVNSAASVLLMADDEKFENSLREGMEIMARCLDVDRIYIWQNGMMDGVHCYIQQFEWLGETGQLNKKIHSKTGFTYPESMPEWETKFSKGECVNGPLGSLSHTERQRLEPYGIKSILVIPVHLKEGFWGFVSYDDCHQERRFTEDEISILRSGSLMIAHALARNDTLNEIREADERAKLMLDATPLSCSLWNEDIGIIDCNEEAVTLFELDDKREFCDRFWELSPEYQPDGRLSSEKALRNIAIAFREGRVSFEWMHQKPDGTPMPSEITLVRVRRGKKNIVAGYNRDVREYKKMMNEIQHRDSLLRTVNEVAAILLQTDTDAFERNLWRCMELMAEPVSADRVYIWKNYVKDGKLYATQLYEWSERADPQQGKSITTDIASESVPCWTETLTKGQCINGIVRCMPPGEQMQLSPQGVLSILVVPVFLRGELWGFVGFDDCHRERVFTDNEETILRSASLLIAHALLRNEMTLDIRVAVAAAQEASRAKSNFLSSMSHEIRTPLNAIIGMTLIGKTASTTEKKDYAFGKIESASSHLLGVINDILDISKIEASKFELADVEFNFEKMLQKVVNVIHFRVDEKQQRFSVRLDKDIPQNLIGDDQRLAQVITNLLSNAVKFTPEQGSIRLDTHLVDEVDGVCTLRIEVMDTGIGISKKQQARLFTSFVQAEASTSRTYGGTGLGLAISKHIVELMNGDIWVESEVGKGSTFGFTVRIKRGSEGKGSQINPGAWKNIRVLVVDDDPELREYLAGIAAQFRIACDTAASGEEALARIDKVAPYDVYFVDLNMPGMDGIEFSRRIKAREASRSAIIMIASVAWNEIEEKARATGVDEFLSKPLFPSEMIDCINKCIGLEGALSIAETQPLDETESLNGYCVLLAEDMEINCEIVKALLEPTQLTIECAMNGTEAVQIFSAAPGRYDMILMDVQMPEMDGLEATQRIRGLDHKEAKEIPIIAMTANVFREDIERCLAAGMNDHVGKPINIDEVMDKIRRYLRPKGKGECR